MTERLTVEQHQRAVTDLIQQIELHPEISRDQVQFLSPSFPFLINEDYLEVADRCECGGELAFIASNGDVQPCGYAHVAVGNLKDATLEAIWTNAPILREWRTQRLNGKCTTCKYAIVCQGGCRAAVYETTGSLSHPDPLCWVEVPG